MALNDVTEAMDGWLETIIGTRNTGSYVSGRWVAGTPSALSFTGVVQNATPQDLKVLPEGQRTEEAIKIHTAFELIPQNGATNNGDIILYKSTEWRVYNCARRFIGGYFKAIAIRQ